jgi:hypothetical protein
MFLSCAEKNATLGRIVLPLAAGLLLLSTLARSPAQADEPPRPAEKRATTIFVIAANEGYGVMDCLVDGVVCGKVVADSWCEAHGKGVATAYGLASDITGSIPVQAERAQRPGPNDVIVACAD